jgi:hypothetical protein
LRNQAAAIVVVVDGNCKRIRLPTKKRRRSFLHSANADDREEDAVAGSVWGARVMVAAAGTSGTTMAEMWLTSVAKEGENSKHTNERGAGHFRSPSCFILFIGEQ